ncbi:FeoA family protein [Rhodoferax sp.]|uniref:FeoA family protein n=1 Tax=Rhodoferax sp. TaxID=50421 RepID=UPI0025D7B3CE|nr:FeoA family protein [Rhodoferax sp.]
MPHTSLKAAARPVARRTLDQMAANSSTAVVSLSEPLGTGDDAAVTRRLGELGFLPGEIVTVLRRGPGGRDPIAVQIGETVFALRSLEASCIEVSDRVPTTHS